MLSAIALSALPAQAAVDVNFSTIPLSNIVALGVVGIAAFAVIIAGCVWAAKTLNIKKIGSIDILEETKKVYENYNHMTSCQHFMDDEIHDVDDALRIRLQELTQSVELHTMNVLRQFLKSGILQESLAAHFSLVLTASVIKNHFTKELMPDRYKAYRERITTQFEDRYLDAYSRVMDAETGMPSWGKVGGALIGIVDNWLGHTKEAVRGACGDKIDIYSRYAQRFKDDEYRTGIVNECIEKNKKYIANLT
jgi:hypothetical protein